MPRTVLEILRSRFPSASTQTLKRMAASGRVQVNGRLVARLKHIVGDDDRIDVLHQPPATRQPSVDRRLAIVHEDDDLLVVNKPPGLLTSTVAGERRPTLLALVREHVAATSPPRGVRPRVGLIHRLDRDAAGLLVFSKNDAAYRSLKTQLFHHDVERVYAAVVEGIPDPPAGRIESHLVERADGVVYSTRQHGKGEHAVTDYETLQTGPRRALLRVTLQTGRKHQIRVHLSARGTPIAGDTVYGRDKGGSGQRLLLCAIRLTLAQPSTGKQQTFEIPIPDEFTKALNDLAQ